MEKINVTISSVQKMKDFIKQHSLKIKVRHRTRAELISDLKDGGYTTEDTPKLKKDNGTPKKTKHHKKYSYGRAKLTWKEFVTTAEYLIDGWNSRRDGPHIRKKISKNIIKKARDLGIKGDIQLLYGKYDGNKLKEVTEKEKPKEDEIKPIDKKEPKKEPKEDEIRPIDKDIPIVKEPSNIKKKIIKKKSIKDEEKEREEEKIKQQEVETKIEQNRQQEVRRKIQQEEYDKQQEVKRKIERIRRLKEKEIDEEEEESEDPMEDFVKEYEKEQEEKEKKKERKHRSPSWFKNKKIDVPQEPSDIIWNYFGGIEGLNLASIKKNRKLIKHNEGDKLYLDIRKVEKAKRLGSRILMKDKPLTLSDLVSSSDDDDSFY